MKNQLIEATQELLGFAPNKYAAIALAVPAVITLAFIFKNRKEIIATIELLTYAMRI